MTALIVTRSSGELAPGQVFGRLTLMCRGGKLGNKRLWYCRCACGSIFAARSDKLHAGRTKSCGCGQHSTKPTPAEVVPKTPKTPMAPSPSRDLRGWKFFRLTPLEWEWRAESSRVWWLCKCDCGNQKWVRHHNLTNHATRSCGCISVEKNKAMGPVRRRNILAMKAAGTYHHPMIGRTGADHPSYKHGLSQTAEYARSMRRLSEGKRRTAKRQGRVTQRDVGRLWGLQRSRCAYCETRLNPGGEWHLDHILPLALGGEHVPSNIQLTCPSCNMKKAAKHPEEWANSLGLLL